MTPPAGLLPNHYQLAKHAGGSAGPHLVGEGCCFGEGVEIAQGKGERHRLLHVDHHLLLRLVDVAVRPERDSRAQKSVQITFQL